MSLLVSIHGSLRHVRLDWVVERIVQVEHDRGLWINEPGVAGVQHPDLMRLRTVVEANDAGIGVLRGELAAERSCGRLELRLA